MGIARVVIAAMGIVRAVIARARAVAGVTRVDIIRLVGGTTPQLSALARQSRPSIRVARSSGRIVHARKIVGANIAAVNIIGVNAMPASAPRAASGKVNVIRVAVLRVNVTPRAIVTTAPV
jgi:hypothetical protein